MVMQIHLDWDMLVLRYKLLVYIHMYCMITVDMALLQCSFAVVRSPVHVVIMPG